ncbi:MAG: preprotein translocase subunit SecA [Parachlamydiaceae bacterium]
MFGFLKRIFGTAQDRQIKKYFHVVKAINDWELKFQALSDEELRAKTDEFRSRFAQGESLDHLLPETFAVVKNACRRLLGTPIYVSGYDQNWDMVPFDVQLVGGIALHHGSITEMQTGEGKTLTAVLPLYLNALTGKPVHLVTVNDYLATRDCEWTGTVLRWLGLTTGSLTNATPQEERKQIYLSDVVYGTSSEFGFDYLRDNSMASRKEDQVQRGFFYAIIDEADSILIDEARTPLIISGPVPVSRQMYDELKGGVSELVRLQRDFCNRLGTEARKVLEKPEGESAQAATKRDRKQEELEEDALRKLWLVSKGTPTSKVLKRLKENPDIRAALDRKDLYYHSDQNKDERMQVLSELYMIIDERSNDFELTDKGIHAWQDYSGGVGSLDDFTMLDISHEYLLIDENPDLDEDAKVQKKLVVQAEDAKRKERAHNLRQLLRAHLLMEKDVDYIVYDGKIVIIDENTGRPQPGRRFSDGLHQAIEAKENVSIQKETQTYATITLQNYFRMYSKLAGMTGTASTEANEFKQIYKTDVLAIPTHHACVRTDHHDEVYMTEREKYNAILKEIKEIHEKGRPILIGTESVEISEKLSRILRQHQLEHTVLNAKQHDREAEIVAQAGRRAAITIATNMAGRGTDIKLEQGVSELGGLHVIGTTRHQSRRIDRQLRGRGARQGDPGSSKFYVSFEDALIRLFASPRLTAILQKFRPEEGEAISASILNKSIETAQKRIEQRNYTVREHTLKYDDVMNKQRQEIYAFRNDLLHSDDVEAIAVDLLHHVCESASEKFFHSKSEEGGWDPEGFRQWLLLHFPLTFEEGVFDDEYMTREELAKMAADKVIAAFKHKMEVENSKVSPQMLLGQSQSFKPANEAIRSLMIRHCDRLWQEHLLTMDHLRADVNLRTVGQRDPLMEFKHEAFSMFDEFGRTLREDIAHALFSFEIMVREQPPLEQLLSKLKLETNRSFSAELEDPQPEMNGHSTREVPQKLEPIVVGEKVARNEFCPCGSGKKYKKCCGMTSDV